MVFKEAKFYKSIGDKIVACKLCPHNCIIGNGEDGNCNVKRNVNGKLKSMNYGKPYMSTWKKVEDNSVYHFFPGSEVLNVACPGNNLKGEFYEEFNSLDNTPTLNQTPSQIVKQLGHSKKRPRH
jgi:pyruvate formate lyase activating enzyme